MPQYVLAIHGHGAGRLLRARAVQDHTQAYAYAHSNSNSICVSGEPEQMFPMWKMHLPIMPSSASTLPVAGDNAAAQVSRSGGGDREHYSSSKCCKYPQDKHFLISLSSRFRRCQFPRSSPLDLALLWQLSKKEKSAFPRIRSWTPQILPIWDTSQSNIKVESKRSQTRGHSGYAVSRLFTSSLVPRPSIW